MVSGQRDDNGITLRDVVIHMQHMEQRLSEKIDANTVSIRLLKIEVYDLKTKVNDLEDTFTSRMDALDEDLVATMKDTMGIRKFVGMPMPSQE